MKRMPTWKTGVLLAGLLLPSAVMAAAPKDRPFSLRGVELGITLAQFRAIPVPSDGAHYINAHVRCSDDGSGKVFISSRDRADGLVDCRWYSSDATTKSMYVFEHWIDIGTGKGQPTFRFMSINGELRLFRISLHANNQYHAGILDALTRGYGAPKDTLEPVQNKAGANYTSLTSVWDNGFSRITLIQRCDRIDWYCLDYDHATYIKSYNARDEKYAADAAGKI